MVLRGAGRGSSTPPLERRTFLDVAAAVLREDDNAPRRYADADRSGRVLEAVVGRVHRASRERGCRRLATWHVRRLPQRSLFRHGWSGDPAAGRSVGGAGGWRREHLGRPRAGRGMATGRIGRLAAGLSLRRAAREPSVEKPRRAATQDQPVGRFRLPRLGVGRWQQPSVGGSRDLHLQRALARGPWQTPVTMAPDRRGRATRSGMAGTPAGLCTVLNAIPGARAACGDIAACFPSSARARRSKAPASGCRVST